MHISFHHVLHRKRKSQEGKKNPVENSKIKKIMDDMVYVSAFLAIFFNIPQLVKIWSEKNTAGVSVLTWIGFLFGSIFWLFYGIIHKEKPIIVANFIFVIIQFFIVLGLILRP